MSFHIQKAEVKYGEFLNIIIQFLIIAAAVYSIFKGCAWSVLTAPRARPTRPRSKK